MISTTFDNIRSMWAQWMPWLVITAHVIVGEDNVISLPCIDVDVLLPPTKHAGRTISLCMIENMNVRTLYPVMN